MVAVNAKMGKESIRKGFAFSLSSAIARRFSILTKTALPKSQTGHQLISIRRCSQSKRQKEAWVSKQFINHSVGQVTTSLASHHKACLETPEIHTDRHFELGKDENDQTV